MRTIFENLLNEFGFRNIESFWNSLVVPKYGLLFLTTSGCTAFIETYFGMRGISLILLLILIKIELFTGILASLTEKKKIVSRKLQRFVLKIMIYFFFIMIFHVLSKDVYDFTQHIYRYMHSFTIMYFVFVHIKSITENYDRITGKKSEFSYFLKRLNQKFFSEKDDKPS